MAYEKPEVFTLTLAVGAVLSSDGSVDGPPHWLKSYTIEEAISSDNQDGIAGSDGGTTSSTASAYEADE